MHPKIKSSKQITPMKLLIYGNNGTGKSTFAANANNVLFLDLEKNLQHLNAQSFKASSYEEIQEFLEIINSEDAAEFKTIAIDSIDVLLDIFTKHILKTNPRLSSLNSDYAKGWGILDKMFGEFLSSIEYVRERKNKNIILICQYEQKTFNDIDIGVYTCKDLALPQRIAKQVKNWANAVLYFTTDDSTREINSGMSKINKKISGNLIMHTTQSDTKYAKNPYGLPEVMPVCWQTYSNAVKDFFKKNQEKKDEISFKNTQEDGLNEILTANNGGGATMVA